MAATKKTRKKTTRKASRKKPITAADLTRFRYLSKPQISPDGKSVVFLHKQAGAKNKYETNLWMVATDGGRPRQFTSSGKDGAPQWSPDGDRVAFVSGRDEKRPQIYVIDAAGGEATALTKLPEGSIGEFKWSPDGTRIACSFREQDPAWTEKACKDREEQGLSDPPRVLDHWFYRLDGDGYFNGQRHHLSLVDVATGGHRAVYKKDTLGFFSFAFSPDGRQMVISTNRDRRAGLKAWTSELVRLNLSSGKLTPIRNLPEGPKDAVSWSPDGSRIAYAGRESVDDDSYGTENLELWTCDPVKGDAKCLTGKEDYCLMAVTLTDASEPDFGPVFRWASNSKRLFVQIGWHGQSHLASVKASGGPLTFHTSGAKQHNLGNISRDGRTMAMAVGSPTKLDEIHVASLAGERAKLTALTDLNGPLLAERQVAVPRSHWVKTADGTKVHVWVLRPAGETARRKRPAVLEIHGGPHAQYGEGFFHEFQALAAAGYTVFYSNPRGSKGYGRDHCHAIRGSWGQADWVDVQAVIGFMKEQPFVDATRMGVMGGSYGGYMTNWVIGHTREFAGAITDRCVSNMVSMAGNSDFVNVPDIYWEGNPWDRPEALWRDSPIRHFNKVRTPTLIIHSEGDLRCNVEQAEQVYTALSLRNVPARPVRYPRSTSHGMSRGGPVDMRLHRLGQILEWWERYL